MEEAEAVVADLDLVAVPAEAGAAVWVAAHNKSIASSSRVACDVFLNVEMRYVEFGLWENNSATGGELTNSCPKLQPLNSRKVSTLQAQNKSY